MRCECKWVNVWVPMIWKLSGKGKLFLWKWKLSWKCRERWLMTFLLFSLCPTCLPITSPAQNCLQFELTKICFVCPPWFYDLWSDLIFFSCFSDLLHRLGLFLHANTTGGTANLDFNFRFSWIQISPQSNKSGRWKCSGDFDTNIPAEMLWINFKVHISKYANILKPYILKASPMAPRGPEKIWTFRKFSAIFLLRTRKISHTHRTRRVFIGKNISVIFSMINMEV